MRKILFPILIILVLMIDRLWKWWVIQHPSFGIYNQNFLFGQIQLTNWLFYLILILLFIIGISIMKKPLKSVWLIGLILAGVVSNVSDRLIYKSVIDYWKINHLIFNLADLMVISGVLFYGYSIFRDK